MSISSTPYLKMGEKISVGLEIGRAGHPLISARHTDEMLAAAAGSAQSLWNSLCGCWWKHILRSSQWINTSRARIGASRSVSQFMHAGQSLLASLSQSSVNACAGRPIGGNTSSSSSHELVQICGAVALKEERRGEGGRSLSVSPLCYPTR